MQGAFIERWKNGETKGKTANHSGWICLENVFDIENSTKGHSKIKMMGSY